MSEPRPTRWMQETGGTRGASYAARFRELAASGADLDGEARLVAELVSPPACVLDAGCGTGRVAITLAQRGFDVVGVDLDISMLLEARSAAPELIWHEADLVDLDLSDEGFVDDRAAPFDLILMAGNVLPYAAPGTEGAIVASLARHLCPRALLLTGASIEVHYDLARYDADCAAAGLDLVERWATWDRAPYDGGPYAVSLHRAPLTG